MIELVVVEHKGTLFPDISFNCKHCSQLISRTVNVNNMCKLITCINCGRTEENSMVLLTDIKKRVFEHVKG